MLTIAVATAFLTMLAPSGRAAEHQVQSKIPVRIALVGDDALTENLEYDLEKNVRASRDLQLSKNSKFVITTSSNVQHSRLGGRSVVVYRALLTANDEEAADKIGVCFENDINRCARDIVKAFTSVILIQPKQ